MLLQGLITRSHVVLTLSIVAVTACGDGDSPPRSATQEPLSAQAQDVSVDPQATTAPSLPTPAPADVPVLSSVPPATTDEPPPRAPISGPSKIALSTGVLAGMVAPSVIRQTVAAGLVAPTDLAFTIDGVLFYTERLQGLFVQRPGQAALPLFAPPDLSVGGSLGMLAVAVDPEFVRNRFVYVFIRAVVAGTDSSRVVRLALDDGYGKVLDQRDILLIAAPAPADASRSPQQAGGGLRFGPDGLLYVGIGDNRVAGAPQSPQQLAGKVLRIDREGKAAPGNHPPAGYDSRVYAYGMRDPVALAFHPNTETLLVAQRRGGSPDDLTWIKPGANGGWDPRCQTSAMGYCEPTGERLPAAPADGSGWRGGKPGEGLTAVERLRGPMWGDWRNSFVVAFDKAQRLDLVKFNAQGRVVQATPALQKLGVGFKAVAQGPDALYVMTSGKPGGEEIWRLSAY